MRILFALITLAAFALPAVAQQPEKKEPLPKPAAPVAAPAVVFVQPLTRAQTRRADRQDRRLFPIFRVGIFRAGGCASCGK